jgi:hypothetical protein
MHSHGGDSDGAAALGEGRATSRMLPAATCVAKCLVVLYVAAGPFDCVQKSIFPKYTDTPPCTTPPTAAPISPLPRIGPSVTIELGHRAGGLVHTPTCRETGCDGGVVQLHVWATTTTKVKTTTVRPLRSRMAGTVETRRLNAAGTAAVTQGSQLPSYRLALYAMKLFRRLGLV